MPNKCKACWNYGKSIMYCIFKCEGIEKVEDKGCKFCNRKKIIDTSEMEISVFIDNEGNTHFLEIRTADTMASIAMNYCLFCGAKL